MPARRPVEASPKEHPPKINLDEKGKYYKRPYKINAVGREGLTTTVAIPREIIKRAAEKVNLPFKDFISSHQAVLIYNSFDGAFIRFEKRPEKEDHLTQVNTTT